jgi:hypothetical protein
VNNARPSRSKWRDVALLVTAAPAAAVAIALEARFSAWWPLRFPRSIEELEQDPQRLTRLLTAPSPGLLSPLALPAGASLSSVRRGDRLTNEPDKNRTTAVLELGFRGGDSDQTVRIVVKFQSGRGMPLYMQAIRAALESGFAREIAFYRTLAPVVPVRVAKPIFADAVTPLNRVCLIAEYVESTTVADWRGCPLPAMQSLLGEAAKLNAHFLGRLDEPPTAWIPAREGLDFMSFVSGFIGGSRPWYREAFAALHRCFTGRPVTLVHGDCRPGNMLFTGEMPVPAAIDEDASAPWPESSSRPGVVMSDWEAVNVAPLLWDFTYATVIGLRVGDRQAWLDKLLAEFLSSLEQHGVSRSHLQSDACRLEVDLLAMALAYLSLVIIDNKLWSGQGNTVEDGRAWISRVIAAATAGDPEAIGKAIGVDSADVRRIHQHWRERRAELLQ